MLSKKVLKLCQKGTANWNQKLSTQDIIEYSERVASAIKIIKGLPESQSEVADDRRAFDTTLFERISNQVGLQEKPAKIMRLGEIRANHESSNCRPMRVVFCREDPVIELIAKRNVKLEDKIYWFNRDLTQSERKLKFEARKKRRDRQNVSGAHVTRSSTCNTSARNATSLPVTHNDIGTSHK